MARADTANSSKGGCTQAYDQLMWHLRVEQTRRDGGEVRLQTRCVPHAALNLMYLVATQSEIERYTSCMHVISRHLPQKQQFTFEKSALI